MYKHQRQLNLKQIELPFYICTLRLDMSFMPQNLLFVPRLLYIVYFVVRFYQVKSKFCHN